MVTCAMINTITNTSPALPLPTAAVLDGFLLKGSTSHYPPITMHNTYHMTSLVPNHRSGAGRLPAEGLRDPRPPGRPAADGPGGGRHIRQGHASAVQARGQEGAGRERGVRGAGEGGEEGEGDECYEPFLPLTASPVPSPSSPLPPLHPTPTHPNSYHTHSPSLPFRSCPPTPLPPPSAASKPRKWSRM